MAKSQFIIVPANKTHCGHCSMTKVHMLCHRSGEMLEKPAFYICPSCGRVGQIGVGPVSGRIRIRSGNAKPSKRNKTLF